jgi:hypothetical protein
MRCQSRRKGCERGIKDKQSRRYLGAAENRGRLFSTNFRANPRLDFYSAKPFTNSTTLRNAMPDGPLAIQGF